MEESKKPKRLKSWHADQFLDVLGEHCSEDVLKEGETLLQEKAVLDFLVSNGKVRAKVSQKGDRSLLVEVFIPELSDEEWEQVFEKLAKNALFLSQLLSGHLPLEIENVFSEVNKTLVPANPSELSFAVNGKEEKELTPEISAALQKLAISAEKDGFMFFTLRGRGKDETLLELRRHRGKLQERAEDENREEREEEHTEKTVSVEDFWSSKKGLDELSFTIKADELPAAILKWLDPLPLRGLEDDVEFLLEDAYVHIAKRAQAFGLGLD